ncbi:MULTISPECIES: glycosyltransferase family 2 protein [Clostridium]|uniref:glycosyltransferase family 2 protein n=1 Tax=Clostridium TaxID=1485 RepID=UPI0012E639EB|nr:MULTISPECIES: glycosyltransferase family 2 protein [Clostridium]MBS4781312.1 glycosyltransferase family 2 protein [Clostridium sp.]CAI3245643.1 Glyco_trans_2-like domain-containing protein [Clostridium neonatale]SUQ54958.1 Dodecaprenyl-phosphate galacturonate synthase [Clostridium neonatale]
MKYSIIIPCYNEEENIVPLITKLDEIYKNKKMQIVLVNNGSMDKTLYVLEKESKKYPYIKIVDIKINQGYGYGLLKGLESADGEFVGWIHADMQLDPSNLLKAISVLEKEENPENVFIKGKRKNRPFLDNLFTFGMSIFETCLFKKRLYDIGAIPVIFHRSMIKDIKFPPRDFAIELYVYYIAKSINKKIIRVPINLGDRKAGKSSWNTGLLSKLKQSMRIIKASLKIKRNKIEKYIYSIKVNS